MMKLCSVAEVRAAEKAADAAGQSARDLMATAGRQVANALASARRQPGSVLVLVGPGNNGGDGLVAAGELAERGWTCHVWGYKRYGLGTAPVPQERAGRLEWVESETDLRGALETADSVLDAVFGTGSRAEVPAEVAAVFRQVEEQRVRRGVPVWALDLPSGVDADTGAAAEQALHADVTLTIGVPKIGLYRASALRYTGLIRVLDIGLPRPELRAGDARLTEEADVRTWLPRRTADTHKHEVGWLLVVGGGPGYYGAPRMAAEAAYRAGAGLVGLAVPPALIPPISTAIPEAIFVPLPEGAFGGVGTRMAEIVREALPAYRALLIGPGLGRDDPVDEFLAHLFGMERATQTIGFSRADARHEAGAFDGRAVIDADGLNWLATRDGWWERVPNAELVLTPHPGELARLLGTTPASVLEDPWQAALNAARTFGQVVVLKQGHPVVATPSGDLWVGPQVLPALATAGTGDVLAGIIGGLLAQGMDPESAAVAGVFVGTAAAELATSVSGTLGLVAHDVIASIPPALGRLYDPVW